MRKQFWYAAGAVLAAGAIMGADDGHYLVLAASHAAVLLDDDASPSADDDAGQERTRVRVIDGRPVVALSPAQQEYAGIGLQSLKVVQWRDEARAYATVVDREPLVRARAEHEQALAEHAVMRAQLTASEHEYRRLSDLGEERMVAPQQLQRAEADWQRDQAMLEAARARQQAVRDTLVQQWSETIAAAVLSQPERYRALISPQRALLLVTLPPGSELPDALRQIEVSGSARGRSRIPADLLCEATRLDPQIQGPTWFFTAAAQGLRTGMRLDAWLALGERSLSGARVPADALVWHNGEPWVYLLAGQGQYARHPLGDWRLIGEGEAVFSPALATAAAQSRQLVIVGAQTLLSEEFRWQIPEEDDD